MMARLIAMRILPYKTGSIVIQFTTLVIDCEKVSNFAVKALFPPVSEIKSGIFWGTYQKYCQAFPSVKG